MDAEMGYAWGVVMAAVLMALVLLTLMRTDPPVPRSPLAGSVVCDNRA